MWKGVVLGLGVLGLLPACGGSDGGSPAGDRPALPDRVAGLVGALDTALFECPDRVWPGSAASYKNGQVLLVSVQMGTAYLWNDLRQASSAEAPRVSVLALADLGLEWQTLFNFGTLFGSRTLGLSLDETAEIDQIFADAGVQRWHETAVELLLHEGFHFLGSQPSWRGAGGAGSRSTPFPQRVEPRYLRAALAGSLLSHVRDGGGEASLAAAAFWQNRFLTEHQADAEAIRGTDIAEGTAEYATIAGSALIDKGCAASESALLDAMVAHIDEHVSVTGFNAGSEPYQLGVLAGIGARSRGARAAGWEARVESGETPVDVLVAGIAPAPQTDDPILTAGAQVAVDASNSQIAAEVTPLLQRMRAPDHLRLAIPPLWTAGSFSVMGFVTLVDEPGRPEVFLSYAATHTVPGGGPTITVDQSIIEGPAAPCDPLLQPRRIVSFPTSALVTDPTTGRFTVNSPAVTFAGLPAELVQDGEGLTWMCP